MSDRDEIIREIKWSYISMVVTMTVFTWLIAYGVIKETNTSRTRLDRIEAVCTEVRR